MISPVCRFQSHRSPRLAAERVGESRASRSRTCSSALLRSGDVVQREQPDILVVKLACRAGLQQGSAGCRARWP